MIFYICTFLVLYFILIVIIYKKIKPMEYCYSDEIENKT